VGNAPQLGKRVLVLGEDDRSSLTIIRSLGRKGIAVHAGFCSSDSLTLSSRYLAKAHRLPALAEPEDEEPWKCAVQDLMAQERFDLVIPNHDVFALAMQNDRERFEALGRVYLLNDRAFDVTINKLRTQELAQEVGVRTPRSMSVQSQDAVAAILDSFRLPVVLKPLSSFCMQSPASKRLVQCAGTESALRQSLASMVQDGPVQIQEYFEGVGAGVELLAQNGEVLTALQHVRVHERFAAGSSYRKTVPLREDLLEASTRLLRALYYTGVAMVEFRLNPTSGDWVLIEINGRFWGSLPLAVAAGVDFPYYLYQMLLGQAPCCPTSYRTGLYGRHLRSDLVWLTRDWHVQRAQGRICAPSIPGVVAEILNPLLGREKIDTLVADDPLPAFRDAADMWRRLATRIEGFVNSRLASCPVIRRLRFRRGWRLLRQAEHIVFACKGNICRSPFAAHYALKVLKGVQVSSCGHYPQSDRRSPVEAVTAAQRLGIDLSSHRSRVADEALLASADIVIVFDASNRSHLAELSPGCRGKLRLLGELVPVGPVVIPDPNGSDVACFEATYRAIAQAIEWIAEQRRTDG